MVTVEVIFAYVIWGQELAEELSAFRPTHRRDIDLIRQVGGTPSSGADKSNTDGIPLNAEVIATLA